MMTITLSFASVALKSFHCRMIVYKHFVVMSCFSSIKTILRRVWDLFCVVVLFEFIKSFFLLLLSVCVCVCGGGGGGGA